MADKLVVFNDIKDWFPPVVVQKDLLTVPRINIDLKLEYPDGILAKGQVFVKKSFNAKFDAQFPSISKKAFDKVQQTIDDFQKLIARAKQARGSVKKEELDKQLATMNNRLEFCCDQWVKAVEKHAGECFDKAVAEWDKEIKNKIKRAKRKIIIKAVIIAAFIVTAAALAIVAVVVTGGAAAILIPAVIAAAAAAAASLIKLAKDFNSGFTARGKLCADKVKEVNADLAAIEKGLDSLTTPGVDKNSVKQRFKVGWSLLEKHVGQLEKFHRDLAVQAAAQKKALAGQKEALAKTKDDRATVVQGHIDQILLRLVALEKRLNDFRGLEGYCGKVLATIEDSINKGIVPKLGGMRKVIDAFGQITDFLNPCLESSGKMASSVSSYEKALAAK